MMRESSSGNMAKPGKKMSGKRKNLYWLADAWTNQVQVTPVNSPNLYFKQMKTTLLLMRILGRFPYRFTENGFAPFSVFSLPFAYCFVFCASTAALTFSSLSYLINERWLKSESYDAALFYLMLITFITQNLTLPLIYWTDSPRVVRYMERWARLEKELMAEGISVAPSRLVPILSYLTIPLIIVFVLSEGKFLLHISLLVFMPYIPIWVGFLIYLIQWCATNYILRTLSADLYRCIAKDRDGLEHMDRRRRLWLSLSQLSSEAGNFFGNSTMCSALGTFIAFVMTTYGVLINLLHYSTSHEFIWGNFLGAAFCFVYNYIAYDAAHRTTQKLEIFLLTMAANPPVIQYFGFVQLDRGLLVSFVSNTVTYLIVLLQFKTVPMTLLSSGFLPANMTDGNYTANDMFTSYPSMERTE